MTCYLDDDLDQDLLVRLAASRSHRLISPRAIGRSGDHDASHFLYAASQCLPLMTRNAKDFTALHEFGLGIGGHHHGLLVVYEEADRRKNMRLNDIVNALSKLESANAALGDRLVAMNHYR